MNHCLIVTKEINDLASRIPGETPETIKSLVALWQQDNKKSIEEYPTLKELNSYKNKLRGTALAQILNESTSSTLGKEAQEQKENVSVSPYSFGARATTIEEQARVDLDFTPEIRRDRVNLIARLFSNEVDKTLQEVQDSLSKRLSLATNKEEQAALQNSISSLNRRAIMDIYTPEGIFNRVLNIFRDYVNDTDEGRIQSELNAINSREQALIDNGDIEESERFSDEEKLEAAKKRAEYKLQEYNKVVNNFRALAEETSRILMETEGDAINPNYMTIQEANLNEDTPDGESEADEQADNANKEESYKDGWMYNDRHTSSMDRLSQRVRKAIRSIPKLDYEGMYEEDDLGNVRYLDPNYVHAALMDKLNDMVTSDDMIPLLRELERNNPWVAQVIELLENDEALFSQFYQGFRQDFQSYWIQKRVLENGVHKIKTIPINSAEGIEYLIDQWRYNYENGTPLDRDSIYNKNRSLNVENAKKGLKWTETLNNKFSNLSTEDRLKLLEDEKIWKTILKLLNMIGVDADPIILKNALTNIKTSDTFRYTDPIMELIPQLNVIFSSIARGKVKTSEGTEDLINTFSSVYTTIARMLANVTEDSMESSVSEGGKTYYSHANPNYLGKLFKQLKAVNDRLKTSYKEFIHKEFGQYEWFYDYKNNRWRSDWLNQIINSKEIRNGLRHKIVVNFNKVDYVDLDDLGYTVGLLNEYWGEPEDSRSSVRWAWYHVPIMSDSPSAEFVRFRKYVSGVEYDEDGNKLSYEDIILDKLVDVINQEYNRIILVKDRDRRFQKGDTSIEPLANYDISRNKDGSIKSLGGAEFKFFTALNSIKYEGGESFLDRLSRLLNENKGDEARSLIKNELRELINGEFESTYRDWSQIGVLDEENGKFKYLPNDRFKEGQSKQNGRTALALNRAKIALGTSWNENMERLLKAYSSNQPVNDRTATEIFNRVQDLIDSQVREGNITEQEALNITKNLVVKNAAKEALREYYWNSTLATSQIIELTTTDLAFYKDFTDFQKRFKEVHAPSLRLNTKATYKGERIGREWEKTIYLKDDEIVSAALDDIKVILNEKVKKGEMSKMDRDSIIYKFKNVNVADAQAYRSLSSYRAILGMSGQWTDEMEKAYNNFKQGIWDISDFNTIWQTKKPFVYTQINTNSGIEGHTGIKTPVQHKNSEFLLLAMHELIAGPLAKSGKLQAINKFMEDHGIDVVQFESTTKVGKQGVVDLNNVSTESEVTQKLLNDTGIGKGDENPNVVHRIPYEDYGIQTATPEHVIDTIQLVGTQIRKLITADMSPDAIININGIKKTREEWLTLYNAINTENILQKFKEISDIFKNPKEVERVLLEEIRKNSRYSMDMERACTLDENGMFNIPLFDPVQSQVIQTILNSIIKSRVTKQKIKGGALIQVSDYGLTDELNIVFKDKNGNPMSYEIYKREHPAATKDDFNKVIKEARENGGLSIMYLECYMPAYSREFYEPLMKEGTHELDVSKLPDDLRKAIGYRVPTEDKYSMAPLYIKGFLPQQNGSSIMLPSEITALSGSDFDVDKLYVMLPEFKISRSYNIKDAWNDFYASHPGIVKEIDKNYGEALQKFIHEQTEDWDEAADLDDIADLTKEFKEWLKKEGIKKHQFSETAQEEFSKWFQANKENYFTGSNIRKINYNLSRTPEENGQKARNNMLIDMMWGVLTNSDTASKVLNPGGFDYQKKSARIMDILNGFTRAELAKVLEDGGVKFDKTITLSDGKTSKAPVLHYLMDLPLDLTSKEKKVRKENGEPFISLTDLADITRKGINPLSPRTQVYFHQQNMTGAKLIGIYANHNANHALIQHTQLGLSSEGSFILNGKRLTSLHGIMNDNKEFISRNNAGYLAASVDNVKDPVLASLNQNTFTSDATMLLSRLGYNPIEIGLLMNQPIVRDITQAYFRGIKSGEDRNSIIDGIIKEYKIKAGIKGEVSYEDYKKNNFSAESLADNIILYKELNSSSPSKTNAINLYNKQVAVGFLFKRIMKSANALSHIVQATRADTSNGGAGPTIADTELKIQRVEDLHEEMLDEHYPLNGVNVILSNINTNRKTSELRDSLLASPLPYLQAFYTLGVEDTSTMLGKYFPQLGNSFRSVINNIRNLTKSGRLDVKTINNIYNDLMAYIMSKTEFFGAESDQNSLDENGNPKVITAEEKRNNFINNFPSYFGKVVKENKDIADIEFIKRLKVVAINGRNPVVVFKNVGRLSPSLRESYSRDWASLLYMNNHKAQELALNLFRYNYFRNGFAFGPSTFIHLAPLIIRKAIPGYVDTLNSILQSEDDYTYFIEQYVYNHLDNRRIVPEIPDGTSVKFTNEKGEAKDEVTITIDDSSNSSDKKIIKNTIVKEDGTSYEFLKFIAKRNGDEYVYYRLNSALTSNTTAVYDRIEPLGERNNFIEYEYGKSAQEMTSVIKKSNKNNITDGVDSDYDSFRTSSLSDDDLNVPESRREESDDAMNQAFKEIYNSPLEGSSRTDEKDVTSIKPNTEYKDEDNNDLCGMQLLKEF